MPMSLPQIVVIQGANLAALGTREPHLYGQQTLQEIHNGLQQQFHQQCALQFVCSNHEGVLLDNIHSTSNKAQGFVINPGAYTHTSYALADALADTGLPCIEVHLTNVARREAFRRHSCIAPVCLGTICGLGTLGYALAIQALLHHLQQCANPPTEKQFGTSLGQEQNAGTAI